MIFRGLSNNVSLDNLQPQVCVYYDAWENDNEEEPILSMVYSILQSVESDFDFTSRKNAVEIASKIGEFFTGKKFDVLLEAFEKADALETLKKHSEDRLLIKEFLDSLLQEKGNRLIILVDELDRCRPSFAVRLLEHIKHHFLNDRITFVFSINIDELQNTVKQYYGGQFNACKYLDRFFDLRISLPPADLQKFYESINFNNSHFTYDRISDLVIKKYHFELREISKYLLLIKIAAHAPATDRSHYFLFSEGKAMQFCLLCIVPIMIGLKVHDSVLFRDFIDGKNFSPLISILASNDDGIYICNKLLNDNETYTDSEDKIKVKVTDKLKDVYNALFIEEYQAGKYQINIGELEFSKKTRQDLLSIVSLLSPYADYDV